MAGSLSDLVRLDAAQARAVYDSYSRAPAFFPLVGAVLEGAQDGIVLADDASRPRQVYVEHAFGFAQILGPAVPRFEAALQRYLLVERAFAPAKVRLYTPHLPSFLAGPEHAGLRSERRRFCIAAGAAPQGPSGNGLSAEAVGPANYQAMEAAFGVALRFWRTPQDFIAGARAVMALRDGQPAAICYAAAVSGQRAEIDVLTLAAFRQQGAGRFAVAQFVQRCRGEGIEPLWDCFTNNQGSLELCRSAGFQPAMPPYPFFTIAK